MVVRRAIKSNRVVPGGGAIEMHLSRLLKQYALSIEGKLQVIVAAFAHAMEIIPQQLAENAGFDSTDILNLLRQKHYRDEECVPHAVPNTLVCRLGGDLADALHSLWQGGEELRRGH